MKVRHSESLVLIWRLAELEARALKAANIEPVHLMLGLCKSVDLDLPSLVQKDSPDRDGVLEELLREVRRLRNVFRAAGLDACAFRRALRGKCGCKLVAPSVSERLRRSKEAKQVFADAEHFAELAGTVVFPVHLLYSAVSLADEVRDALLDELGVELERLRTVAKREVAFPWAGEKPSAGRN